MLQPGMNGALHQVELRNMHLKDCVLIDCEIFEGEISHCTLSEISWAETQKRKNEIGKENDMWISTEAATVPEKLINMAKVKSVGVVNKGQFTYWVEVFYEDDSVDPLATRATEREAYECLRLFLKELQK